MTSDVTRVGKHQFRPFGSDTAGAFYECLRCGCRVRYPRTQGENIPCLRQQDGTGEPR